MSLEVGGLQHRSESREWQWTAWRHPKPESAINASHRISLLAEAIPPCRQRARKGQRCRLINAACNGSRDRVGGDHAELGEPEQRIDRLFTGCGREHHVTIVWRMDRIDG